MLEGGVKIFEYQPTMIHTKLMVVDGLFSLVGSSNFDSRSSEINEKLDVVVYGSAIRATDGGNVYPRSPSKPRVHP